MADFLNSIDNADTLTVVIYALLLIAILLFMEINDKREEKLFINGRWVKNDYDPIGMRIFFLTCLFVGGVSLFFIIKFFTK